MGWTRRRTLEGATALAAAVATGCDVERPIVDDGAAGDDPRLLEHIEHVVVLTMENRSFDHMLGALSLVEGRTDVDGLTGEERNADLSGTLHRVHPLSGPVANDPVHSHEAAVHSWGEGHNDGFVWVHHSAGLEPRQEVMGYHTREDLPILYALADEYTVCDRWFCSVPGPTWPNRLFMHCASSNGNLAAETALGLPSLYDRLDDAGISSAYYFGNLAITALYGRTRDVLPVDRFFDDADAGTLPSFCFVDPALTTSEGEGWDDHPPLPFSPGQAFVAAVYEALARSPLWPKTLLVLTYDEHGGIYDHVPPPEVVDERPAFRRLGFRVPTLLIGPTVRRGYTHAQTLEHVSVHATINRRFGLDPLNERAARARDVSGAIDPRLVGSPRDPIALPRIAVREPPPGWTPGPGVGQEELRRLYDGGGYPSRFDLRPQQAAMRRRWMRRLEAAGIVQAPGGRPPVA